MSTYPPTTIDAVEVVAEFAILDRLLSSKPAASALDRYLEFQAYVELVRLAAAEGTLPSNHGLSAVPVADIEEWIRTGKKLQQSFQEKIRDLLLQMQAAGSRAFGEICDFYCRYKNRIDAGFTAASIALTNAELAALIAQYKFDVLLFHGVPVTSLLVLAIKWGILDDICDCKTRLA